MVKSPDMIVGAAKAVATAPLRAYELIFGDEAVVRKNDTDATKAWLDYFHTHPCQDPHIPYTSKKSHF